MSQYNGTVLVLDFFSTWCLACRDQFRELAELEASQDTPILSVGSDPLETEEEIDDFAAKYGATWPIALDTTTLTAKSGIRSLPGVVVIDPEGMIRYRHEGTAVDAETMREVIERSKKARE